MKEIADTILRGNHASAEANVETPEWQSLEALTKRKELDTHECLELQPEKSGRRRFLYRPPRQGPQANTQRRVQMTNYGCMLVDEEVPVAATVTPAPAPVPTPVTVENDAASEKECAVTAPTERIREAILKKDIRSRLPDTYRLSDAAGQDLGLAAIRSLEMSRTLRETMRKTESVRVIAQWVDSFQKYEIKKIV